MQKYTFEDIEKNGLLLYRYIRGSHAYGTQLSDNQSDIDEGGIYLEPIDQLLGLGLNFQDEISDEKHDKVWYGLRKYMNLLCNSNPNILESLFVDDEFVIYEHPIITELKAHRQEFVTKECFKPFLGYCIEQIKKCRGYNKKCMTPIHERLWPIDFCYTTYRQGSKPMTEWLECRGLDQRYCGLVSLKNMPMCYSVFYDFAFHNREKYGGDFSKFKSDYVYLEFVTERFGLFRWNYQLEDWFNKNQDPIGYRGIVREDGKGNDIRLTSVEKEVLPICTMTYNKDGFQTHCRKYKEYQEWLTKRNPVRYSDNEGYNFDSKNVSHSFRLINMGLEIAKTGEVHVNRTGIDADFLRDIRNHKYTYDELITELEKKKAELDEAIANSTLPESVSRDRMNELLVEIRRKYQLGE